MSTQQFSSYYENYEIFTSNYAKINTIKLN